MNSTWKRLIINIGQWVTYKELVHLDVFGIREEHYPLNSQSCSDTEKRHSRAFIRAPHLARHHYAHHPNQFARFGVFGRQRWAWSHSATGCNTTKHNEAQVILG